MIPHQLQPTLAMTGRLMRLCFVLCYFSAAAQNKESPGILGAWISREEHRIFSIDVTYDHMVGRMDSQKFTFYENGVMLSSSGFITSKKEPPSDPDQLPWIYCGNFASFKMSSNTLEVFHPGDKAWMIFEILLIEAERIILRRNSKVYHLRRAQEAKKVPVEEFSEFQIEVFNESFLMSERLTFDRKNNLIVENLLEEFSQPRYIKLSEGYFNFLCRKINGNKVMELDTLYSETESRGGNSFRLRMRAKTDKEILVIGKGPDAFSWAVLPMMYCEDLIDYPDFWLKVDFSKY